MREVYRESIASRAPEQVRFAVTVPPAAWLDVGLGTVDEGAVTFRVAAEAAGQSGSRLSCSNRR